MEHQTANTSEVYKLSLATIVIALLSWVTPAKSAQLFYLDESVQGQCIAKTMEIPSKKEKKIFSTKSCPSKFVWDVKKKQIFYIENGVLWSRPSENDSAKSKKLGSVDPSAKLWISDKGNPMIAYLVPVADKDVITEGTGNNRKNIFNFNGEKLDASGLIPEGMPYVAIASELSDGKWKQVETQATRSDADDTPGLSVLGTYQGRKNVGMNVDDLLIQSTCAKGSFNCDLKELKVKKLLGKREGYGSIKISGNYFVFATGMGDTVHAIPPVYFCKGSCDHGIMLKDITENQLSFAVDGDYLLIATEYENRSPHVYDGKTGNLIINLPQGISAVWFSQK